MKSLRIRSGARVLQPSGPAYPSPELYVVPEYIRTWQQAEQNAVLQLRFLGFLDARLTPPGTDDIDVTSKKVVGQVKYEQAHTGKPSLARLYGTYGEDGRELWFFTATGYSKKAVEYADEKGILLFTYSITGELESANDAAEKRLHDLMTRKARVLKRHQEYLEAQRDEPPGFHPPSWHRQRLRRIAEELIEVAEVLERYETSTEAPPELKVVPPVDLSVSGTYD